jgi:hypothetical protein
LSASISANWFRDVIEPLADSFDPAAVDEYVRVFTAAIARPGLAEHYQRIRHPRVFTGADPDDVYVLSRVTLGADVAITSVVLDAALRRFPHARTWFVGPRKNYELFERSAVRHLDVPYRRTGTLAERLAASEGLRPLLDKPNAIVLDPDSRLTQLGLIPVCDESRYYFFESRSSTAPGSLSQLTAAWIEQTLATSGSRGFIAPMPAEGPAPDITISLGVGENQDKRIPDPFERSLLEHLASSGRSILIDKGAGGEETERVERAIAGLPNTRAWQGPFAPFAAEIARSRLYIGYDSAGQHVAAACAIPLITIFAGFPNDRFLERWTPTGHGQIDVIRVETPDPDLVLTRIAALLTARPIR